MEKYLPDPIFFINKVIPNLPGNYTIIEKIGSGQNGHLFKAHSSIMNHFYACKIVPIENLKKGSSKTIGWKEEFLKPNTLNSPIVVKINNYIEWKDTEHKINCIAFISDYIKGKNLKEHFTGKPSRVEIHFIERFLLDIFSLFNSMQQKGIFHGDLHEGNILIEDRSDQLGGEPYVIRVTDFGVSAASNDTHLRDDYEQLAEILKRLLSKVDFQQLSPPDKYKFDVLNKEFLVRHLTEKDITRNPLARAPRALYDCLNNIQMEYNKRSQQENPDKLLSPFDYLSCEQIGDSHDLLKSLYSELFLGLEKVESRNNLVLTGPRGCGKSTVFKSLSLGHRTTIEKEYPENIHYIGIYYQCYDLYAAFQRYQLPEQGENFFNIPLHYLGVTLISEVLNSIERWARAHFQDEFSKQENQVSALLWATFLSSKISKPKEPGADTFQVIISRLEKERNRVKNKHIQLLCKNPLTPEYLFGPEVLISVCDILNKNFSFLRDRPFYFFIDDYSIPKISMDLQRNLNRLLMQRTAVAFFKISTESPVSYSRSDIDGKEYVEGREFQLVNLGLEYLVAAHQDKFRFMDDIFIRRFRAVENYYVQNLDQLIGDHPLPSNNELARKIKGDGKSKEWGKQMLFELCSGDIFYIIELVGKMVIKSGGDAAIASKTIPKIKEETQINAIREEAGTFLDSLGRIEGGKKLVKVVTAFGNVANFYLKHKTSKNAEHDPPYQASRIEPMETPDFSDEAQEIYNNLLRYSLFIEDPRGKSIRGKVVPRLFLRRSLIPFFNLTFSTRDSIRLDNKDMEMLFIQPEEFADKKMKQADALHENGNIQRSLFPDMGGHDDHKS